MHNLKLNINGKLCQIMIADNLTENIKYEISDMLDDISSSLRMYDYSKHYGIRSEEEIRIIQKFMEVLKEARLIQAQPEIYRCKAILNEYITSQETKQGCRRPFSEAFARFCNQLETKIDLIKAIREYTGCGLYIAKVIADEMYEVHIQHVPTTNSRG